MAEKYDKTLVIIDGKSVFYRGFYAMGNLSKSDGTPTSGVYGFAMIAMELVRKLHPDKVVVAWDKAKTSTSKRKAIYSEYKAGRVKPPEDFFTQIPLLRDLVTALGWGFLECDDYEADDIIGTLALQADQETFLVDSSASADALLTQRMSNTSRSVAPASLNSPTKNASARNHFRWMTYIISSDLDMLQIVDENTRMYRLLKGFSNLEEFDVAAVEEKYGIRKAQFLDLKAIKGDNSDNIPGVPGIGEKGAVKLLNEYGTLQGVYEHLDEIKGAVHDKLVAGKESAFMSYKLAKIMTDAPVSLSDIPDLVIDKERIISALKFLEFNSLVRKYSEELTKLDKGGEKVVDESDAIEVVDSDTEDTQDDYVDPKDLLICQDVKQRMHSDLGFAEKILNGARFWDLSQADFLLNPLQRKETQVDLLSLMNFDDDAERQEFLRQRRELKQNPKLYKIYTDYDLPLIPVLYKMEKKGVKIDKEYFSKLQVEYKNYVSEIEQKIYTKSGVMFNINSPIQLSDVLFIQMVLPTKGIKKTTRGYSTGAKELGKLNELRLELLEKETLSEGEKQLLDGLEIVPMIIEYREASKLLSTYITPLPSLTDSEDAVHTTFTQNVTATGRLSSVNPNLQNIPVRTEEGKRIRAGFIARSGKIFVSADYSQFELRLAAVLAGDESLIETFNSGVDVHTKTASEVFEIPMEEVTKNQRRVAKTINFGIMYGMSPKGLADATGMKFWEAKKFIDDYFRVRKPIKDYLERILTQARTDGFVETYYGRRRPTPDVNSSNFVVRQGAERAAQNMPIQGTEADLMKKAMIAVDQKLPLGADLVLQIHDSMIVECDENLADEVAKILKETMEGIAPELKIKLAVEVTTGPNWGCL